MKTQAHHPAPQVEVLNAKKSKPANALCHLFHHHQHWCHKLHAWVLVNIGTTYQKAAKSSKSIKSIVKFSATESDPKISYYWPFMLQVEPTLVTQRPQNPTIDSLCFILHPVVSGTFLYTLAGHHAFSGWHHVGAALPRTHFPLPHLSPTPCLGTLSTVVVPLLF